MFWFGYSIGLMAGVVLTNVYFSLNRKKYIYKGKNNEVE